LISDPGFVNLYHEQSMKKIGLLGMSKHDMDLVVSRIKVPYSNNSTLLAATLFALQPMTTEFI
jgi:hypothetical protein